MLITQNSYQAPLTRASAPQAPSQQPPAAEEPGDRIEAFYSGTRETAKWISRLDGVVLGGVVGLAVGTAVGAAMFGAGASGLGSFALAAGLGIGGAAGGYAAFDRSNTAADGSFAIDIGGNGGLPIAEGARVMLTRTLHRDPDRDPAHLRFSGGGEARGLDERAAVEIEGSGLLGIGAIHACVVLLDRLSGLIRASASSRGRSPGREVDTS